MRDYDFDPVTDPVTTYNAYQGAQQEVFSPEPLPGSVTVTTINGVTGPTVTFTGGTTGMTFTGIGTDVVLAGTLAIANGGTGATSAGAARTALGAAAAGANGDINTFTALTGNTGWSAWTGSSDKTAHATYSGTASVGYVQAELQGVMDKLKEITEAYKALQDVLLGIGITEA